HVPLPTACGVPCRTTPLRPIRFATLPPPPRLFFCTIRPPPTATLFPYTTLFRSERMPHDLSNLTFPILASLLVRLVVLLPFQLLDRKSGSAGMPGPISYAVFCLK